MSIAEKVIVAVLLLIGDGGLIYIGYCMGMPMHNSWPVIQLPAKGPEIDRAQ